MRITQFTDFSLRLLLYLAQQPDRAVTVREIAEFHALSAEHLKKIVRLLSDLGYIQAQRGKNGGLRLARTPDQINLGQLVREEENLTLLPCPEHGGDCPLAQCRLARVMDQALAAFLHVLDGQTLADLLPPDPFVAPAPLSAK